MFKIIKFFLLTCLVMSAFSSLCQTVIDRYVCEASGEYDEFIYEDIKGRESDNVCNAGTKMHVVPSGDIQIASSVTVTRLDGGPHRARVNIQWVAGETGILSVDVYYERREHTGGGDCDWEPWTFMYTYKFHKYDVSPGASFTGDQTITLLHPATTATFNLKYLPSSAYPIGRKAIKIKYWNGTDTVETPIFRAFGLIHLPTDVVYYANSYGEHQLQLEVLDHCGNKYTLPPLTLYVKPSCYNDNDELARIAISGPEIITYPDGSFGLKPDITYSLQTEGITQFYAHYEWKSDGGEDVTINDNSLTVLKELGSYTITLSPLAGREECPVPDPIQLVLGGHNLAFNKDCPIVLPEDLKELGFEIPVDDIVLDHFALTAKSKWSITVNPGVTLELGAELILEPAPPVPDGDLNKNYVEQASFDEYGRVILSTRSYFDDRGTGIQTQYKNLADHAILANATVYDAYGRAALSTLAAPVSVYDGPETGENDQGCPIIPNNEINFVFKEGFLSASGSTYDYSKFDLNNEQTPVAVDGTQEFTLGWYYSANNGTSQNAKLNEPLVATTNYPYSRTLYHHDGSGDVKSVTSLAIASKRGVVT